MMLGTSAMKSMFCTDLNMGHGVYPEEMTGSSQTRQSSVASRFKSIVITKTAIINTAEELIQSNKTKTMIAEYKMLYSR